MKILVLGGAGFIGTSVVDRLITDGHSLRVFDRPSILLDQEFFGHEKIDWISGDFSSTDDLDRAIAGVDLVIHLISTTEPKSSNDDPIYDVKSNLLATLQLLNSMVIHRVPKIIFLSSGGTVYGKPLYLPIDENHPTDPIVSYGITKLAIEKFLLMYQRVYGIKTCILRAANPYGERQRIEGSQGAIGVFLKKAIMNQPIEIWGDGNVIRDYLYVEDVSNAIASALHYQGDKSVFNISSGEGVTLNELIDTIELVLKTKVKRNYVNARPFDVPISILDNSIAKMELNWEPKTNFEEGIAKTAEWIKKLLEKE